MVNVTKSNFLEQSRDFLEHLPKSVLISIDEEMTGISIPGKGRPPKDDDPSTRFQTTLKEVPERYAILQVGICLFLSTHEIRQYNFYLFPNISSNNANKTFLPQREVTLNPASMAFLKQHDMDFNLWIREGIPYCTSKQEAPQKMQQYWSKRSKLLQQQQQQEAGTSNNNNNNNGAGRSPYSQKRVELTRPEDIHFHARTMATLREWLDNAQTSVAVENRVNDENPEGHSLLLPACNSFLRRALYESIQQEYPSLILEKYNAPPNNGNSNGGGGGGATQIRVWRLTPEERKRRQERLLRHSWESFLSDELGFWRILIALALANRGLYPSSSSDEEEHWLLSPTASWKSNPPTTNNVSYCDDDPVLAFLQHCPGGDQDNNQNNDPSSSSDQQPSLPKCHLRRKQRFEEQHKKHRPIPLVVHNGLMDLLFLLTHCHAPFLPSSLTETKQLLRHYFPLVYDTKVLATESLCRQEPTVLAQLYQKLVVDDNNNDGGAEERPRPQQQQQQRFVITNTGTADTSFEGQVHGQSHEAAYDAFMTGAVFVNLCQQIGNEYLQQKQKEENEASEQHQATLRQSQDREIVYPWNSKTDDDTKLLRQVFFLNKLYLMLTMYTIDLENPADDPLSRGMNPHATFRVAGSDPSVTSRDIVRCVTATNHHHGWNNHNQPQQPLNFEILWVNETTFLVALRQDVQDCLREQTVLEALQNRFRSAQVCTLEQHLQKKRKQQQEEDAGADTEDTTAMGHGDDKDKNGNWLVNVFGWFGSLVANNDKRNHGTTESNGRPAKRRRLHED